MIAKSSCRTFWEARCQVTLLLAQSHNWQTEDGAHRYGHLRGELQLMQAWMIGHLHWARRPDPGFVSWKFVLTQMRKNFLWFALDGWFLEFLESIYLAYTYVVRIASHISRDTWGLSRLILKVNGRRRGYLPTHNGKKRGTRWCKMVTNVFDDHLQDGDFDVFSCHAQQNLV